jgi:hypothetical protein
MPQKFADFSPAIPVKNDKNKKKNATIYKATTDRAISIIRNIIQINSQNRFISNKFYR